MVSALGSFAVLFALMVKSREVPTNYILLGIFVSTTTHLPSIILCYMYHTANTRLVGVV